MFLGRLFKRCDECGRAHHTFNTRHVGLPWRENPWPLPEVEYR